MSQRKEFLHYFFESVKGFRCALLKDAYDDIYSLPETADIDLVIDRDDLSALLSIINKGKGVVRIKIEKKSFACFVRIFFEDLGYLEIDLLHRFDRKGIIYKDIDEVLDSCVLNKQGIRAAALHHQFDYIILFCMLNKADVPEKYQTYFAKFGQQERSSIFAYITEKYDVHINTLNELYKYNSRHRKKLLKAILSGKQNRVTGYFWHRLQYLNDVVRERFCNRAIAITFSGVDGAGKSTILDSVKTQLEIRYRQPVKVLRHRPSILPILSSMRYGKKKAEQKAATTLPRLGTNDNPVNSLFRFGYYYMDFMLGRFYIYLRYTCTGTTVLYDRYYFDFIVDGKRSNISLHPSLIRLGYVFVSKPEVNFFLYAPENEILKRKQELNAADIRTMTDDYMHLFVDLSGKYKRQRYVTLNNEDLDKTMSTVMKYIISAQ